MQSETTAVSNIFPIIVAGPYLAACLILPAVSSYHQFNQNYEICPLYSTSVAAFC